MREQSRRVALSSMMVALGAMVMLLGGVIPAATFLSPALAGVLLLPVFYEFGAKWALGAYVAIALLALMLSPDKEAALLFAFLGYYPVLKARLDRVRLIPVRTLLKLLVFNLAAGAMLAVAYYVFGMSAILAEYAEMTKIGLIVFIVVANFTMLVYDVMLAVMMGLYRQRLRPKLFHQR